MRLTLDPLVGMDKKPAENPGDGAPSVDLKLQRRERLTGPLEPEFARHPEKLQPLFPPRRRAREP